MLLLSYSDLFEMHCFAYLNEIIKTFSLENLSAQNKKKINKHEIRELKKIKNIPTAVIETKKFVTGEKNKYREDKFY